MITTLLVIAGILYLALQLEDTLKIPSPLGLIALSFVAHYGFQKVPVLTGDAEHFAALVIFLLPILLISDSLEIKLVDLKEHGLSLLYLAVVAVGLSVVMALFSPTGFLPTTPSLLPPSLSSLPWSWPPIRFPLSPFSPNLSCRTV